VKVSKALTNDTQDAARMSVPRTGKRLGTRARSKSNEVDGLSRIIVFSVAWGQARCPFDAVP
jgi:hypothetical protein